MPILLSGPCCDAVRPVFMSRNHHSPRLHTPRPPSWAWSGVVLFSTLLLSPVASANLLSALARALPQWATSAPASQTPFVPPVQIPPRRASDEEAAACVLLQSVLEERAAETDETVTPNDALRSRVRAARAVFVVPPGGFYVAPFIFPPARMGGTPAPACVGLLAPRAPPLV